MTEPLSPEATPLSPPRWPRVVGTIGIVVGVLMFLDKLDDLLIPLLFSEADWSRLLGPELAARIVRSTPDAGWRVLSALIGIAIAVLLVVGASRLRRLRRSGVTLCRAWSWLVIAYLAFEIAQASRWFIRHAGDFPELGAGGWQGPAACGIAASLAVLLAFPLFLLIWLSRPQIQSQWADWPD